MSSAEDELFGTELKDGFKVTEAWINNGIKWLDDIQAFYRERAALEKEYSQKLAAVTKKYFERKAKKSISLSVGDTPQMTPGSLESASLVTWTEVLTQTENISNEHDRLGNELQLQVADQLRGLGFRYDEFRKRHVDYNEQLDQERDATYSALKKAKQTYDAACQSVENSRSKLDKSSGDKGRLTASHEKHVIDMNNAKNAYLVAVSVANRIKDKYYFQDVPAVLDSLQDLNEARTRKLNSLWATAAELEQTCSDRCRSHLAASIDVVRQNVPRLDSKMFVQHNIVPDWKPPDDFYYEPSPIWHDDDQMVADEHTKTYLRNTIAKSRRAIGEMRAEIEHKRADLDVLYKAREQAIADPSKANFDEIFSKLLSIQQSAAVADTRRIALAVEVETVEMVVGDLSRGSRPHNMKQTSFKIPTTCGVCGESIMPFSRQGMKCGVCGYACHSKCELKIPSDCSGTKLKKSKSRKKKDDDASSVFDDSNDTASVLSRPSGMFDNVTSAFGRGRRSHKASDSAGAGASSVSIAALSIASSGAATREPARAKFAYAGTGQGETALSEGDDVVLLEPHDGTGWVLVENTATGGEGLVPFSYLEVQAKPLARTDSIASSLSSTSKKKGPAVAPRRGGKKLKYVVALYDYEARTDVELTIHEGDRILVTAADTGDGWTEGELNGASGSFPTDYVQAE
ncbi:uncharacterized protein V1510DRAFT_394269 [Dipodascopsis tothii]|uniref:uncharacterized protein n=1 Tax=Dipodascopsis tothii TaxID=44089 RepID=UPI0034CFD94E